MFEKYLIKRTSPNNSAPEVYYGGEEKGFVKFANALPLLKHVARRFITHLTYQDEIKGRQDFKYKLVYFSRT